MNGKNKNMNIGDKYLKMKNPEDISSAIVVTIDDVFEMTHSENCYECTIFKVEYCGKITKFQN
jgi:hypothetical protein